MEKAKDLKGVYRQFSAKPIPVEDLDKYYVSAIEGRGDDTTKDMELILLDNANVNTHFIFAGYKGCGKSTELNVLKSHIQDRFLIIDFSVMEELDPFNLNYIELFITIMERLFGVALEHQLSIDERYLEKIQTWLGTEEIVKIKEKYIGTDVDAGLNMSFGIPYLQEFFAKFRVSAKNNLSMKQILTRNEAPKISELIKHCNDLISEVKANLKKIGKQDILIIIEDMDKIFLDVSTKLFYMHSNQLTQLRANCIFTFPIGLVYNPLYNTIGGYFRPFILPMIKVNNKNGTPFNEGREIMRTIVRKRMDESLFEEEGILEDMIENSGGCLRDLFRLITTAANKAQIYERLKISREDYRRAYNQLKRDYDSNISDKTDVTTGEVKIHVKDYQKALIALANSTDKQPDNSVATLDLRQNLCILGYNDEGWCNVHPLVKQILKDKGLIT